MEDFIYLEPDDEIPSIVKKLKKAKEKSLGLVVPRGSITLQSAINLKLLKKEAAKLGKEIALVTADHVGQHLAAQAGLTVYESVKAKAPLEILKQQLEHKKLEAHEQKLPVPDLSAEGLPKAEGVKVRHFQTEDIQPEREFEEPRGAPPASPTRRPRKLVLGTLLIITVVTAFYTFVVPRVTIVIEVLGEPFERELVLKAATVSSDNEPIVEATFEEATKELSRTFKTTGQKNVGEKAKGSITLNNAWSSDPQPLAAGTKLIKDSQSFKLNQAVTIPGASVTLVAGVAQTNPGKIQADIEAEGSGEAGNVAPGKFTIIGIEKAKQDKIYGESSTKLTGGTSKFIGVVSADDLKNARSTLEGELKGQLKDELAKKVAGQIILDQAARLDVLQEMMSKQQDEEASEFELKLKGTLKSIAFTDSSFRRAFLKELGQELGDEREVVFGPQDEIITTVEEADFENGRLVLRGVLKSQVAPKLDQATLKRELRFKSFVGAEKILRDLPQVSHVAIGIAPKYSLKRIPVLGTNVKFEVKHK